MLSDEVIEKVTERLINRLEQGNEYILEKIGESVKIIGTLSPTSINEINQIIDFGGDYNKIAQKLADITKLNVEDIYAIFDEVAKNEYQFSEKYYKYRDIGYIPYEENISLQDQVRKIAQITANDYYNLSNSSVIGYLTKDLEGNTIVRGIEETYKNTVDTALLNISEGKQTFDEAMRSTLKEMSYNGLQAVEYESGATRRLDSAVRMSLNDGLNALYEEMDRKIGHDIDADGVEITAHPLSAPDHIDAQGRQFSTVREDGELSEWEKLQLTGEATDYNGHAVSMVRVSKKGNSSFRPISWYNCRHRSVSVVLGVSEPIYSEEELQDFKSKSGDTFTFEDKEYTMYEGTQLQRRIETEVRRWGDTKKIADASGNTDLQNEAKIKIRQLKEKYEDLSAISGLPQKYERLRNV